jgi:hypothetical protein
VSAFITNARRAGAAVTSRDPVEDETSDEPYDWREG